MSNESTYAASSTPTITAESISVAVECIERAEQDSRVSDIEFLKALNKRYEKEFEKMPEIELLQAKLVESNRQRDEVQIKYSELLQGVARKFPEESRHDTALRYIWQAEMMANTNNPPNESELYEDKAISTATGNGGECSYPECECAFDMQDDNKCLLGKQSINPTGMPDCRTCKFYGTKSGECTSVGKCSNKYMMYQPLNKVVLYATGNGGEV